MGLKSKDNGSGDDQHCNKPSRCVLTRAQGSAFPLWSKVRRSRDSQFWLKGDRITCPVGHSWSVHNMPGLFFFFKLWALKKHLIEIIIDPLTLFPPMIANIAWEYCTITIKKITLLESSTLFKFHRFCMHSCVYVCVLCDIIMCHVTTIPVKVQNSSTATILHGILL